MANEEKLKEHFDFEVGRRGWGTQFLQEGRPDEGLLSISLNEGRSAWNALRDNLYQDEAKIRPYYLDLIHAESVNAAAFLFEECDFVGITWGALHAMYWVFMRLLSNPEVRPDIGQPDVECAERARVGLLPFGELMKLEICRPKDPVRLGYASVLFNTAVHFLVGHEVGHIMHGHLPLPIGNGGEYTYLEIDDTHHEERAEGDLVTLHALEMDADSVGIVSARFMAEQIAGRGPLPGNEAVFDVSYANQQRIFQTIVWAAHAVFRVFDVCRPNRPMRAKHPPPPFRAYWTSLCVFEQIRRWPWSPDLSLDEITDLVMSSILEAEEACNALFGRPYIDGAVFGQTIDAATGYYFGSVKPRWSEIRGILVPRMRGGSLAS